MSGGHKYDDRVKTHRLLNAAGKLFGHWTEEQFQTLETIMAESYQDGVDDTLGGSKPWTVLGVYEADGSTFCYPIRNARDAHDAMRIAAADTHYDKDLCILGAVAGEHDLIDACEDSRKSCNARDLEPEEIEGSS